MVRAIIILGVIMACVYGYGLIGTLVAIAGMVK